jgi:hypothetical protein
MRIKRYIHEEAQYEKTPETKRMQQHEEERGAGLRASLLESPSKGPTVKAGATPQETSVIRGPTSFREATTETFYTAKGWVGEKLGGDRYLSKERNLDDEGSENGGIEEDKRREELAKQLDMGMDEGMDEGCEY